jgi:hypothetical protein
MFNSEQKSPYASTTALLIMGFILSPAVWVASHPGGYISPALALACSAVCAVSACAYWKIPAQLGIAAFAFQRSGLPEAI